MMLGAFYNVSLETVEEGQHLVSLCCWHREFLQRGGGMPHKERPVAGADAQAFVGNLHIAARVEDRAAGSLAHVVDDELAVSSETVLAVAFPKYAQLGIIEQSRQEIIRNGGNGIIATKAFVQGLRLHAASPLWG
jgi:hypothetical protein